MVSTVFKGVHGNLADELLPYRRCINCGDLADAQVLPTARHAARNSIVVPGAVPTLATGPNPDRQPQGRGSSVGNGLRGVWPLVR